MQNTDEHRLEVLLGNLLRAGVMISALVVLAGCTLYLVRHGSEHPDYRTFRGEPSDLRTLRGILDDAAAGAARGIINLGLLLLIATPVARVAFSAYSFVRLSDRKYVFITLTVLALLMYSIFGVQ